MTEGPAKGSRVTPAPPEIRPVDRVLLAVGSARVERPDRDDGGRAARSLKVLRTMMSPRPPLFAPLSGNAIAAGTAAVIEMRSKLSAIGERDRNRPARDVAREVLSASAPFVQADLLSRVASDRLWVLSWITFSMVMAGGGLLATLVYALVVHVPWLAGVVVFALAGFVGATLQICSAVRRQARRVRSISERPLTGPGPAVDDSAETVDITTAAAAGKKGDAG